MANIKYLSARRYQVGWYDELPDPYEDSNYSAHSTNNKPGQNAYWNFLGIDGSKIYESWIKFSFTDEDMLNPQQVGSINFNLRFEFHKDRSSAKNDIPIRCYIFPTDLDKAYKIRTSSQMEKDKKYITYAETEVDFDNLYKLANFNLTIKNPTSNTYLAVLKIHPDYETSGWCPVVWYGQGAVGGALNSTARAWKSNEILPSSYDITFEKSDGDSQVVKAEYNDSLKGSYITNIPTASKNYYTFKGWASTENASTRNENLYKSTGKLGPFTSDTTLYPVFQKNRGTLEIECKGITRSNCQIIEPNHSFIIEQDKITFTYDTNDEVRIMALIATKPGYQFINWTANSSSPFSSPFSYKFEKIINCGPTDNEKAIKMSIPDIEQINYTIQYQIGNFIIEKINKKYGDTINEKIITQAELKFKNCTELGDFFEVYGSNELFEVSVITELSDEEKVTFGELNWKEQVPESLDERNKNKTNIITLIDTSPLSFEIPELNTVENIFAQINSGSETTFGQEISINDNSQAIATNKDDYTPPDDTIIDLTQVQINIWNGIGMGQNFTFIIPHYEPIIIYREAGTYTLTPEDNAIELGGSWWTTHQGSPFAEFYLNFFNGASQILYLDKGITLYPVSTDKTLWVDNKYFNPEFQIWKEGGN